MVQPIFCNCFCFRCCCCCCCAFVDGYEIKGEGVFLCSLVSSLLKVTFQQTSRFPKADAWELLTVKSVYLHFTACYHRYVELLHCALNVLLLTSCMGWCSSCLYYLGSLSSLFPLPPTPQAAKLLWETV